MNRGKNNNTAFSLFFIIRFTKKPITNFDNFMNIAILANKLFSNQSSKFKELLVQTIFKKYCSGDNRFLFISNSKTKIFDKVVASCETIFLNPVGDNRFTRKIWWDYKLPRQLSKIKAELLISFDDQLVLNTTIPQCLVLELNKKVNEKYLNKAAVIIVESQKQKKEIAGKGKINADKIQVVYPYTSVESGNIKYDSRQETKEKYTEGKEFFLYKGGFEKPENFVNLLKGFSHFKNRQKSNFNLVLINCDEKLFVKDISSYKYRRDIKFIEINDKEEEGRVLGSAYGLLAPFDEKNDMMITLEGMQSGIPVIVADNSTAIELAKDGCLVAGTNGPKEVGEKMILLYVNETLRTEYISKAKLNAETYTIERTSEMLWKGLQQFMR